MIPFNKPSFTGNEEKYIKKSIYSDKIAGDGVYTKKCQAWFEKDLNAKKTLLTTSCTHALEISAILLGIKEGDEVIMPSYTFVSTANAFALRGAKIIFVDVRADTMNIDETKVELVITKKTKAIVVVHYAGVSCEMDTIMDIAKKNSLFVIEDAAQAIRSYYKGKALGTIGHLGTFSFHETKNITSAGEGGLLIINDEKFIDRAEIIREKGTNRNAFFKGLVDKYSWVDLGSSYLLNDVSAAYLWGQLKRIDKIQNNRIKSWNLYKDGLDSLALRGDIELPIIPDNCTNNAHNFYIKVKNKDIRGQVLSFLTQNGVNAVFHYVSLHSSKMGEKTGIFKGKDKFTTKESERLIRFPMFYGLDEKDIKKAIKIVYKFFEK